MWRAPSVLICPTPERGSELEGGAEIFVTENGLSSVRSYVGNEDNSWGCSSAVQRIAARGDGFGRHLNVDEGRRRGKARTLIAF